VTVLEECGAQNPVEKILSTKHHARSTEYCKILTRDTGLPPTLSTGFFVVFTPNVSRKAKFHAD
jgi:hypothetical protein